ncbi:hypothetical protein [Exiguobacterium antarcticum]|uniref:hypothetical protein n=1 Tax=Exiguobacterium antarcticum TaxID=132920 RepID=UPI00054F34D0|nr:hypothetical protein [Exiguobacterium antarcticum]
MNQNTFILSELEARISSLLTTSINDLKASNKSLHKEWLTLSESAAYAGVSYNTFIKFRLMGLKVCEIDGIKRVSKKEINSFLERNSF